MGIRQNCTIGSCGGGIVITTKMGFWLTETASRRCPIWVVYASDGKTGIDQSGRLALKKKCGKKTKIDGWRWRQISVGDRSGLFGDHSLRVRTTTMDLDWRSIIRLQSTVHGNQSESGGKTDTTCNDDTDDEWERTTLATCQYWQYTEAKREWMAWKQRYHRERAWGKGKFDYVSN